MSSTITPTETLATLLPDAVARNRERVAVRHREGTGWRDVSYAEVGDTVTALALGLIALGIEPGDRVAILANTRPEWTYADFAISMAGCVVVPIYPTNSAQECEWVLSDSDAVAVICEDASALAKVAAVRDRLPGLRTLISIESAEGAISLEQAIERGRAGDWSELDRRMDGVQPDDRTRSSTPRAPPAPEGLRPLTREFPRRAGHRPRARSPVEPGRLDVPVPAARARAGADHAALEL